MPLIRLRSNCILQQLYTTAHMQSNCILQHPCKAIIYHRRYTKQLYSAASIESNYIPHQIYKAIVYCSIYTKQLYSAANMSSAALQTFPGVERRPHDKRTGSVWHTTPSYQLKLFQNLKSFQYNIIHLSRNELTKLGGQIQMSRRDKSG